MKFYFRPEVEGQSKQRRVAESAEQSLKSSSEASSGEEDESPADMTLSARAFLNRTALSD